MTTFDNNSTGFGMTFDEGKPDYNAFTWKYHANIVQSQHKMIRMPDPSYWLPSHSPVTTMQTAQTIPCLQVTLPNESLDSIIKDLQRLKHLEQFLSSNEIAKHEYFKALTWETLSKPYEKTQDD